MDILRPCLELASMLSANVCACQEQVECDKAQVGTTVMRSMGHRSRPRS